MTKFKRLVGLLTVAALMAMSLVAVFGSPAFAKFNLDEPNQGGVIVGEGDSPDCVSGSCGGMILEDPNGIGPDCDWGNCGGSVCAGPNCGSCEGGNCGGSISGTSNPMAGKAHAPAAKELPRTGLALPAASTLALGLGMILVGAFFSFVGSPAARLALTSRGYSPKRRI